METERKSIKKRVVGIILGVAALASAGLGIKTYLNTQAKKLSNDKLDIKTNENFLNSPNVTFDSKTNLLSWNKVENADEYRILVEEKEYFTQNNTYDISEFKGKEVQCKVQAIDENNFENSSHFSTPLVCKVTDFEYESYCNIVKFIKKDFVSPRMSNGVDKIFSLNVNENKLTVFVQELPRNGDVKRCGMTATLKTSPKNMKELEQALTSDIKFDCRRKSSLVYFESFAEHPNLNGELGEYRKNGWKLSEVIFATMIMPEGYMGHTITEHTGVVGLTKDNVKTYAFVFYKIDQSNSDIRNSGVGTYNFIAQNMKARFFPVEFELFSEFGAEFTNYNQEQLAKMEQEKENVPTL
ncbi:MAG: hypothetical protein RR140_03290 [Clostridia bacterium]